MSGSAKLRIGIDTGGTFTDIVCVDDSSGSMPIRSLAPQLITLHSVVSAGAGRSRRLCASRFTESKAGLRGKAERLREPVWLDPIAEVR